MMKANELMMGDYAQLNKDVFPCIKGEIVKILSIINDGGRGCLRHEFMVECQILSGNKYFFFLQHLDPIPLTEDILKKIGFEKTKLVVPSYILCENIFTVFAKKSNGGAWLIDVLKTDFNLPDQSAIVFNVHQLQQWLRFCGIEREITIDCLTE